MKTKLELATLVYKYLEIISDGYEKGDFEPLFQYLAEDCVFESQWVLTPNIGYDAVVSYLTAKSEALKKSGSFPFCYIQELAENIITVRDKDINVNGEKQQGSGWLHYPSAELCLLLRQVIDDKENSAILRIELNDDERISRIALCMPELFQYRDFYTFVSLCPCIGNEDIDEGRILVSLTYEDEFYLFLGMADEEFDEYGDLHIPIEKWVKCLECWKRFSSFKTFDEAFEDACGVDYTNFSVKNEEAKRILVYSGGDIWRNCNNNSAMLKELIEWTNKYKDTCDHINCYGVNEGDE